MTGILNDLLGLIKGLLEGLGIENKYVQLITGAFAFLFILILIGKQIWIGLNYFLIRKRNKIAAKDLHPFFTRKEVENATKYYIPTQFQNVPPSEDEEPGRNYIAAARQPLLPLFLKNAFYNDKDDNKYYLVLADSGMGKTTFMINLYLSYKFKTRWLWQRPKFDIKLFPMGHPKTIERINSMSSAEKENCILLLDAFDEDNDAILDYKKRLSEILDLVWEFREIVITCRTQFFPSSKDEPAETGKYKFGPETGQFYFQKIYISVFSEDDIKKYLKKKFKPWFIISNPKYLKALAIVLKTPNLMMRPMLLSHIDDLIEVNHKIRYGYQVYETLINQWLERESNKAGIRKKYGNKYKNLLYLFSRALAKDLYLNRKKRNNKLSLGANEIIDNPKGLQLKDIEGNNITLDKYDQGSRSLLNRNATGEYKFSHKSILEYFLALEVLENPQFRNKFFFDADLDTAKNFFLEMLISNPAYIQDNSSKNIKKLGIKEEDLKIFKSKYLTESVKDVFRTLIKTGLKNLSPKIILLISILSILIHYNNNINKSIESSFKEFPIILISTMVMTIVLIIDFYNIFKIRKDVEANSPEELKKQEALEKKFENNT